MTVPLSNRMAPTNGTAQTSFSSAAANARLDSMLAAEIPAKRSVSGKVQPNRIAMPGDAGRNDVAAPLNTSERNIIRAMDLLKNPANQKQLVSQFGAATSAGVLTYFQGLGGIRSISNSLGTLDFYFKQPHARNLEAMTGKVLRGQSSTPGLGTVPDRVRNMRVGGEVNYSDRNSALANGRDNEDIMTNKDNLFHGLIGAWTVSDRANVSVTRPDNGTYEITVNSTAVAVDKYDWNVGRNEEKGLFTPLHNNTTGENIKVTHGQMELAKKFGAKDFWLAGALNTKTVYRISAQAMQNVLNGGNAPMAQYKVSETAAVISEPKAFRSAVNNAYGDNAGSARSAAVPGQSEVIRPLNFPVQPAPRPEDSGGSGGGTRGIKPRPD